MTVSKRLRFEILRRDNHSCRYCGGTVPDVTLTVDHVLPVALGGSDDPGNLVAACRDCNAGKSSTKPDAPLVQQVTDDALRWAKAVEMAGEYIVRRQGNESAFVTAVGMEWENYGYGLNNRYVYERPGSWPDSVGTLYRRGLPLEALVDAVGIALRNERVPSHGRWNYFMGVCWKKLTQQEEAAKAVYDLPAEASD